MRFGLGAGPTRRQRSSGHRQATVDADDPILRDSRSGHLFCDADGSGKAVAVKFVV